MAAEIRVPGSWTGLLLDWLDQQALPAFEIRALLARWVQEEAVPIPVWQELLQRTLALRPDQVAPALAVGACVRPRHVGVLGYLVLASQTLAEAMKTYQRYERLIYGIDLAQIVVEQSEVEMRWRPDGQTLGHLHDSVAIAALVTFLRRQVENPPPPSLIAFINDPVLSLAEQQAYEEFFGCPVRFGDTYTRVRFPLAYLSIPMPHSDPGLRLMLDRQARALVQALPHSDAFDQALQQTILKLLPDAQASLPRAARELHVSVRTLQRRLEQRELTWQQLLNRIRAELAQEYLADRSLSLGDIALLLGFSEQSAFNRAFRRWTGSTPARVRRASSNRPS
jgi:AraC-like DNA-binding protein